MSLQDWMSGCRSSRYRDNLFSIQRQTGQLPTAMLPSPARQQAVVRMRRTRLAHRPRRPCRRARARQVRLRSLPRGFSSRLWIVRSKKKHTRWCAFSFSATVGTRTRDFLLGKEVLYQLSHCRTFMMLCCRAFVTTKCIIPKKNGFVKEKSIIFRIFHIY